MAKAKKHPSIPPNILKNAPNLNQQGIRVVRLWSNDVLVQTDSVLQALWQEVHLPSPQAPLPGGEGLGKYFRLMRKNYPKIVPDFGPYSALH